jgi:hypothetical protein
MRSLVLFVPISLCALVAALLPACSSSSSGAAPDDTCGFIDDPNNCYRTLLAAVSDCLSDDTADGGVGAASGSLSADGMSCTYASGRTVTFGGDVRQFDASKTPLDVTVALGGKTCVHYVSQPKSSLTITQPDGRVLSVAVAGLGETITCPDGSQHGIDAQKLFGGCGDAGGIFSGGLPGTITGGGGSSVSGSLVGLTKQAYSCKTP